MPTSMLSFPAGNIVDGLCSWIQFSFARAEVTPSTYRWSADSEASRIRISAQLSTDNSKPGSSPSITVIRGSFRFSNSVLNNLESANPNDFVNKKHVDWMDGPVSIVCEAAAASEASNLANFLAIHIQSNKAGLSETLQFLKKIDYVDIGPEVAREVNNEPVRWRVTLTIQCSLYIGWYNQETSSIGLNKIHFQGADAQPWASDAGAYQQGISLLNDTTADFGLLTSNDPQLLEQELTKNWYFIQFPDQSARLYQVEEIMDNNTLRLSDRDASDAVVVFNPSTTETDLTYKLIWNTIHINAIVPNNNS